MLHLFLSVINDSLSHLLFCFFFFLMIRRPPRSTLSSSSAASDVYKRQCYTAQKAAGGQAFWASRAESGSGPWGMMVEPGGEQVPGRTECGGGGSSMDRHACNRQRP
eukprot:TRINITY_DN28239_c0_g1_i1.p1 TRINITY_DN28239_c0_g1~~TRINITY_DN28239_c0_g1_i1.p1  ORF type:complete len:107 (-),score=14.29 TRINITY_DN28239_c0_g1_i1:143-463(-)